MCMCNQRLHSKVHTQCQKINVFFSENHDFEKIKGAECCAFNYLLGSSVIVSEDEAVYV